MSQEFVAAKKKPFVLALQKFFALPPRYNSYVFKGFADNDWIFGENPAVFGSNHFQLGL
jgi:hypothetical protein